jgi:hypothetical protein
MMYLLVIVLRFHEAKCGVHMEAQRNSISTRVTLDLGGMRKAKKDLELMGESIRKVVEHKMNMGMIAEVVRIENDGTVKKVLGERGEGRGMMMRGDLTDLIMVIIKPGRRLTGKGIRKNLDTGKEVMTFRCKRQGWRIEGVMIEVAMKVATKMHDLFVIGIVTEIGVEEKMMHGHINGREVG